MSGLRILNVLRSPFAIYCLWLFWEIIIWVAHATFYNNLHYHYIFQVNVDNMIHQQSNATNGCCASQIYMIVCHMTTVSRTRASCSHPPNMVSIESWIYNKTSVEATHIFADTTKLNSTWRLLIWFVWELSDIFVDSGDWMTSCRYSTALDDSWLWLQNCCVVYSICIALWSQNTRSSLLGWWLGTEYHACYRTVVGAEWAASSSSCYLCLVLSL